MKIRLFTVVPALALLSMIGTAAVAAPPTGSANKPGVSARPGQGGRPNGRMRRMERMAKELGLTETQKEKIMASMRASMPAFRALRENTKLTPEQKMSRMRALSEQNNKKMMAILTPTQRKKLEVMKKQQQAEMQRRMQQMRSNRKPA